MPANYKVGTHVVVIDGLSRQWYDAVIKRSRPDLGPVKAGYASAMKSVAPGLTALVRRPEDANTELPNVFAMVPRSAVRKAPVAPAEPRQPELPAIAPGQPVLEIKMKRVRMTKKRRTALMIRARRRESLKGHPAFGELQKSEQDAIRADVAAGRLLERAVCRGYRYEWTPFRAKTHLRNAGHYRRIGTVKRAIYGLAELVTGRLP